MMAKEVHARDVEQRLSDALSTIDALIAGQIDAVMDSESKHPVLLAKAQEGLRESEERYRRIVETADEGIATLDTESRITFVNRQLAEIFGYPADEMLGKLLSHFMPAGAKARTALPSGASEEISGKKARYVRKDGSESWALFRTSPIRNTDGTLIGVLAMVTDQTHSMVAEEALRKSEEQYRQIVETTTDGIIKIDTDRQIMFVNRRFAAMLGYKPEEMIEKSVFAFMSAAAKAITVDALKNRHRGATNSVDTTFRHKNGTDIAVNLAASLLFDKERRQVGNLGVVRDVTEQKKLEEQLRQSQKMDAVGQLAGGMAHDFNNLLTVINGYSDLAMGQLRLDDPLQQDMEQIKKAGNRAAAMTRQLLAFSRKPEVPPQQPKH